MQQLKTWFAKRNQHRAERLETLANEIAHELWRERTGGDEPQMSPEEAERLAALQDRQTGEKIAVSPLRRLMWGGRQQLKIFIQSKNPIAQFTRFFVWEIPKWNITALKLFLQSDIVKILAVPVVAAIITTTTTINERREREQVETFDEYLNQIDTLTFEQGLLTDEPSPGAVVLARGRTIATLRKLDLQRRKELIAFIQASGLHKGEEAVISFEGANLKKLDLQGADLRGFNFKRANLSEINLAGAKLRDANLQESSLLKANLKGADLQRANLENVDFSLANLKSTNLSNTNLQRTLFVFTNLKKADFWGVDLKGAYLSNVNLKRASLWNANLQGADLQEVNLKGVQYCNTIMPNGEVKNDDCKKE
ncbi:MAG: pentapeptide repeat-containing protein [Cyanobacteria bacterium P01_G01_bin.54]